MRKGIKSAPQGGFTLIELVLVVAFLGSLMLLISASIIQSINIYNKGTAIKQINQAGRTLIEDINRLSSSGADIELMDNGRAGCLYIGFAGTGGRAYLWNSVEAGSGSTAAAIGADRWKIGGNEISLVQSVNEADTSDYCYLPDSASSTLSSSDMTPVLTRQVRILSVDITEPTGGDTGLKKIAFWIGTSDNSASGSDEVPGMRPTTAMEGTSRVWRCQGGSIGSFCAVSKFETIIYTPNEGGS